MSEKRRIRNQRIDRAAGWFITVGGVAIIVSVVLILLLIIKVALPLFKPSKAEVAARFDLPAGISAADTLAVGMDEYLETTFVLTRDGTFTFLDAHTGAVIARDPLEPPSPGAALQAAEPFGNLTYSLLWTTGAMTVAQVKATPLFEKGVRSGLEHAVTVLATQAAPEGGVMPLRSLARPGASGGLVRVDLLPGNQLVVSQQVTKKDIFGREKSSASTTPLTDTLPGDIATLALDSHGAALYAGTANGYLLRWNLPEGGEPVLSDRFKAFGDGRPITAMNLVFGDISLAVGDGQGGLTTWTLAPTPKGAKALTLIHTLKGHDSPVELIVPSLRNKSLLSLDEDGSLHMDHMTSERRLLSLATDSPLVYASISARGNGIVGFDLKGRTTAWALENPHPEASFGTLFSKVWYEGYDKPEYVWQSSASTDDFEPKMSLMPLVFGSFKGTFYAMLYAVPLALFGAVYTSQFTTYGFRRFIKPTVEIMAAIPSVVIGFLVALWLAPVVETFIVPVLVSLLVVPVVFLSFVVAWQPLRRFTLVKRLETGYEFLVLLPVIVVAALLAYAVGRYVEPAFFGSDFRLWLFQETGTRYDQRNAIIIAFGLGFAVIPIIFTIAEDALSSVPHTLKAGSLALGASRWQTVWRVVLPSASPGIFAGIMIGFGRAVGETMIVLMATGNTPIMDWSLFNGMRTLSANIAVEIPEAPVGGTLYRILFLSAVLLFLLTSVLNTAAELVRQRLRKKYGQFNA